MQSIINFWSEHNESVISICLKIIFSVIIVLIGIFVSKGFNRILKKAASDKAKTGASPDPSGASSILRHIVKYGIFIICIIMILNIFGINTTSLLAVLGAAGLAVGLALKNTLGNIASGIILVFLGNYRSGEFIEFGSVSGTVKDISLFTTILETQDGVYVSAPNSCIWGVPLRNYTRNGKRRMEIPLRISASYSIDTVIQTLKEIIACEKRFIPALQPQINIQSVIDKTVTLVIQAWVLNKDYNDIYYQQMKVIKEKMEEAGIVI